LIEYFLLV